MKDKLTTSYTLKVPTAVYLKYRHVAYYDGRSINKDIEQYMLRRIREFETEHGEIQVED